MFANLSADIRRLRQDRLAHRDDGLSASWVAVCLSRSAWAVITYRMVRATGRCPVPLLRQLLSGAAILFQRLTQLWTRAYVHRDARIGPGLVMRSTYGILIGPMAEIGRNCTLESGNVLSGVIGDNVTFGPAARTIANPRIGNNVFVLADTLVLVDIADNRTVAGVPARLCESDFEPRQYPDPPANSTPTNSPVPGKH